METNWVVVAIGFAIIAFCVVLMRSAVRVSDSQRSMMEKMHYPKATREAMTSGTVRLVSGLGIGIGIVWIIVGGFFADKL